MSNSYTVDVRKDTPSYITFSLFSSPHRNNIDFITNNKNKTTQRKYAVAEIYLGHKIDQYIKDYFVGINIDISKLAYLSYIKIIKIKYNITQYNTLHAFTTLNAKNTNKTKKRNKYYNKQNKYTDTYILSKGYGMILLNYIEQYLKNIGIEYIILVPSKKVLIDYYIKAGYMIELIPNKLVNVNNNEYQRRYNYNYVSPFLIMYKKL
jgi:hypothetical protein